MNYPEIADPAQDPSPFTTPLPPQHGNAVRADAAPAAAVLAASGPLRADGLAADLAGWNMPHFDAPSGNTEWLIALMEGSEHVDAMHEATALGPVIETARSARIVEGADLPIQPPPMPGLLPTTANIALPEGQIDAEWFNAGMDAFF